MNRRLAIRSGLGIACLALSSATLADVIVLSSEGTRLKAGSELHSGRVIDLKSGQSVLLLLADGSVLEAAGPKTIHVPATIEERPGLFDAFRSMFRARKKSVRLGGGRGNPQECSEAGLSEPGNIAAAWTAGCSLNALAALEKIEATAASGQLPGETPIISLQAQEARARE